MCGTVFVNYIRARHRNRLQQAVQRGLISPATAVAALEGVVLCVYCT